MAQPDETEHSPSEAFVAELRRWRDVRGFSQSALARAVGYGPSYVSKDESGQQRPSTTFADSADRVLNTGGTLARALAAIDRQRRTDHPPRRDAGSQAEQTSPSLLVEHDEAELLYDGRTFRATQRRRLYNAS